MTTDQRYKRLTTGRAGELRRLLSNLLQDQRYLPGRRELEQEIARIFPEDEFADTTRQEVYDAAVRYAKLGQDRRRRFELRGQIDNYTLKVADALEEADRLFEAEADEEELDAAALADGVENANRPTVDVEWDQERREAAELRRKMGVR